MAVTDNQLWRCAFCGYGDLAKYLLNPGLRAQEAQYARFRASKSGDRLADGSMQWLRSNENIWKAAVGILVFVIGIAAMAYFTSNRAPSAPPPPNTKLASIANTSKGKLFRAEDACNYPVKSSVQSLRSLGGGEWRETVIEGESLGYGCMNGSSSQKEVKLASSGPFSVQVEYAVQGEKNGAKYLVIDYWVDSVAAAGQSEPALRSQYIAFLNDLCRQALKKPLPEDAKKKILNLGSYAKTGVVNEDRFDLGEGYISLSRNRNESVIFVKTYIFADPSHKD